MSPWFVIDLGDPLLATEDLEQLATLFESEHEKAGRPVDLAAFLRHESEGRLHCRLRVYLPPAAEELARRAGGTPCPRPSPTGLSLLAGSTESWPALFPGERR